MLRLQENPDQRAELANDAETCLSDVLWLGRQPRTFQAANLGYQLLLPLGRVVSTKVYLSSKGVDERVEQQASLWRQRFSQSGMQGTAIIFGNGSASDAVALSSGGVGAARFSRCSFHGSGGTFASIICHHATQHAGKPAEATAGG